jgi:apolipoprotein N-acyltransferase
VASMRPRFWIEAGLAVASVLLLVVTLISREWIEVVFGVDPDHGNGSLEWLIVGIMAVVALAFSIIARVEWRRASSPLRDVQSPTAD